MSANVLGAYIAMAGAIIVAAISGVLARRPSRLMDLDVMQASLAQLEKDNERLLTRVERQGQQIDSLEAEVVACEEGRHIDRVTFASELDTIRARHETEMAEVRRTIDHLTRRNP